MLFCKHEKYFSIGNMIPGVMLVAVIPPADLLAWTWHRRVAFISILHLEVSTIDVLGFSA